MHVPDVLDVITAVAIPNVTAHEDSAKQIAPLCTAYGILMFTRWKELSLIQKMNSILLSTGHATERVFNVSQLTLLSCALLQPYRGFKEHYSLFLIGYILSVVNLAKDKCRSHGNLYFNILQTMKRLNRAGVTMTRETYRGIMDDIGSDLTGK